jgi:DNA repair exonuclease SbcCD ATPase subunit
MTEISSTASSKKGTPSSASQVSLPYPIGTDELVLNRLRSRAADVKHHTDQSLMSMLNAAKALKEGLDEANRAGMDNKPFIVHMCDMSESLAYRLLRALKHWELSGEGARTFMSSLNRSSFFALVYAPEGTLEQVMESVEKLKTPVHKAIAEVIAKTRSSNDISDVVEQAASEALDSAYIARKAQEEVAEKDVLIEQLKEEASALSASLARRDDDVRTLEEDVRDVNQKLTEANRTDTLPKQIQNAQQKKAEDRHAEIKRDIESLEKKKQDILAEWNRIQAQAADVDEICEKLEAIRQDVTISNVSQMISGLPSEASSKIIAAIKDAAAHFNGLSKAFTK